MIRPASLLWWKLQKKRLNNLCDTPGHSMRGRRFVFIDKKGVPKRWSKLQAEQMNR